MLKTGTVHCSITVLGLKIEWSNQTGSDNLHNMQEIDYYRPWIIYEWMGNSTRQRFEIRLWKILIG